MNRRGFIATVVTGALFLFFTPYHKIRRLYNRLKRPASPGVREIRILSRIAEYIYPEDETSGALSLGIENFFISQFSTPYYHQYVPAARRLCRFLDRITNSRYGCDFLSAEPDKQSQLMQGFISPVTMQQYPEAREDFSMLVDCTIEGCFSDPTHGGNREKKAWQMLNGTVNEEWFNV
jgi:hypothetical protein